ncbi:hypothetical protein C8R44DRAFT_772154 [Mycena epipterygia]|nr:hypothetical protein C8R44DRAFT_772154 [Mycena epipterygia]
MRDFPQELIDQVIDCRHDGSTYLETIKICGLVCKAWLPRSRYHTFSTVILEAKTLPSFVDLLDTSSLPILPLIRHLKLYCDGGHWDRSNLARLHPCPNLITFEIRIMWSMDRDCMALDWLSHESLHTHLRSWSADAVSLSLFDFRYHAGGALPLRTLSGVLSCFASVPAVRLVIPDISGDTNAYLPFASTHLAHLDISLWYNSSGFFSWLLSLAVPPMLKTLKFKGVCAPATSVDPLEICIQRAGGALESLTLMMIGPWEDTEAFFQKIFQYTKKLRQFTFLCENEPSNIVGTLSLLPTSDWDSIHADLHELGHDTTLWPKVDEILAEPRFRSLKRFSMRLTDTGAMSSTQMKELLPLAHARGILGHAKYDVIFD